MKNPGKGIILFVVFLFVATESFGQLVRKKDYDAAFALQFGGETGLLLPACRFKMFVCPTAGLKMTFPFTRKWFLGGEINYSELKFKNEYLPESKLNGNFHFRHIQLPLYIKYRLSCNKASVLFGVYGTYLFYREVSRQSSTDPGVTDQIEKISGDQVNLFHAGVTVGYEYQIIKHLNIMCRVSAGVKNLVNSKAVFYKKTIPLQACLTLSYDVFRIGDCECD